MANLIQKQIAKEQSILGYEVIGVDGCREPYLGVIKELTIQDHSVLGKVVQVWISWDYNPDHLTPYFPRQFSKWENGSRELGVYYKEAI